MAVYANNKRILVSDDRSYNVSSARIEKELGFTMKKTVKDAVGEIFDAYRNGRWNDPDNRIYHNVIKLKSMGAGAGC